MPFLVSFSCCLARGKLGVGEFIISFYGQKGDRDLLLHFQRSRRSRGEAEPEVGTPNSRKKLSWGIIGVA